MKILAIESSCDDTAAAVLDGERVLSTIVSSQDPVHARYGGVVPELASRSHIRSIVPVVRRALEEAALELGEVDAVAATYGPGLVGSLLVGLSAAKAIALSRGLRFLGVNHLEGHVLSPRLEQDVPFPYLALLVSGGHTSLCLVEDVGRYRVLGQTRDDAAGEAFDKAAKILGLGYPGGRVIDNLAARGDPTTVRLPRARLKSGSSEPCFDFSFSGLKTALWQCVRNRDPREIGIENLAASFQEAVVDMLLEPTVAAITKFRCRRLVLAGGVAANSRLRARAREEASRLGVDLFLTPLRYCTDNAAMIGLAAFYRLRRGERSPWTLNAEPNLAL
ncbi:MAG: tRNA N6-adenosine threonylcarbamoyltransferase [Candidatus Binatia bacterium]|nr:MAG: tRNA N6-adenosine threonylcarbamoyltransferase [Candidatus Binatia bacterium]